MPRRLVVLLSLALLAQACAPVPSTERPLDRINHVIVIYQENWSFDGLFGKFPGANGLANSAETVRQVDKAGHPYATLPPSIDNRKAPPVPDLRIPADLPVAPFDLARYIPADQTSGNPLHRFYQQIYQINGGKMDKFVAWTNTGGLAMSYLRRDGSAAGQARQGVRARG